MQLMQVVSAYIEFIRLVESKEYTMNRSDEIIEQLSNLLMTITNQQSEELKVIE